MFIEKILYNDKTSLFDIYIDDQIFSISYDKYNEYNIQIDNEIDINLYEILRKESSFQVLKKIAENYINYKSRTIQEVRNKLYSKSKDSESIESVILYFTNLNLLNDERYAKEYIDYAINVKKYSINFMKNKLIQKGIKSNIFTDLLLEIDENKEYENALICFNKKFSDIELKDQKNKMKVARFLSNKGYNFNIINKIIEENL